ncbi:MAG: ATP-binding protein [Desulfococcaceae bacterium]
MILPSSPARRRRNGDAPRPFRRSLLPRLVAAILLVSGAATLLATGIQLWIEYREDVAGIHKDIDVVRRSYVEPITTAIWLFNQELLQQHLNGIVQIQDISFIQVRDENGPVASAGEPAAKGRTITAELPLAFPHEGGIRHLGQLRVEADLRGVHDRLRRRVLVVLATQGVKTLVVSAFLFLLFHLLVTRHLRAIADYLGGVDASRPFEPLRLNRGPVERTPGDEFDRLVESLNTMLWLLGLRRADLEKRVAARTGELDRANRSLREKIETLERMEAALRESEERFVAFMANTPTLTFIKDGMGRHLFVNRFFEERYGLTRTEWKNQTDFALLPLHTALSIRRNDLRVIREGRPLDFEETFVRPNGTREFWVSYKFPIPAPDGQRLLGGIAIDFTEKRLMEIELMHARKRETMEVLAGGLAHDFNNLLTVILGNIGLVKGEMDPGRNDYHFLDEAERACLRSQRLTDMLITFAKGGQPSRLPGDIGAVVREAVFAAAAGSAVRVELDLPKDLWRVEFDPEAMREVFSRLAVNAREAMPRGGVLRVTGKNLDACDAEPAPAFRLPTGPCVALCFSDTGRGISPEQIDLVFDPYFSTKDRGGERGMGMGLAVVSAIVRKHEGHIAVTSTPGRGTTFHLHLPAAGEKSGPLAPLSRTVSPARAGRRVLVMDDEEMVRKMLVEMLSRLGFDTESTENGAEAVAAYQEALNAQNPFAVVILDLTVRGGPGGLAAISKLREIDPEVAAVVSSGYSDDPAMANPQSHGFRAGIPKPYTMEKLRGVLEGLVGVDSAPTP